MRRSIATTGAIALAAVTALVGCRSSDGDTQRAEIEATRARIAAEQTGAATTPPPPANNPAAAQVGANLAGFNLVFGSGDGVVGGYTRTGPNTWVGPDLTNYQSVSWDATTVTPEQVVLTSNPGGQTLNINVSNGQVSSPQLDPANQYRMANQVFQ
ncbi:MAG: hypothetical protein ACFCVH_07095 [Alphaproteobacteria bacterium]